MLDLDDLKEKYNSGEIGMTGVTKCISSLIRSVSMDMKSPYCMYCKYVSGLDLVYDDSIKTMCVRLESSGLKLIISPKFCLRLENSLEIVACVSHEIKHIMLSHLQLFYSYLHKPIERMIMNLATDAQVNVGLPDIPKSGVTIDTILKILEYEKDTTNYGYLRTHINAEDILSFFDRKFIRLFGKTMFDLESMLSEDGRGITLEDELRAIRAEEGTKVLPIVGDKDEVFYFACMILPYMPIMLKIEIVIGDIDGIGIPIEECGLEVEGLGGEKIDGEGQNGEGDGVIDNLLDEFTESFKEFVEQLDRASTSSRGLDMSGVVSDSIVLGNRVTKKLPWNLIIKRDCLSNLVDNVVLTKRRINRRQPNRLELSGKKKSRLLKLVVAVDESASVEYDAYQTFISNLLDIVGGINCELTYIKFTLGVEKCEVYNTLSKKDMNKLKKEVQKRYAGGTSFGPIFEFLEEKGYPKNTMIVIFTDGEGESFVDMHGFRNRKWVSLGGFLSVTNESKKNVLDFY